MSKQRQITAAPSSANIAPMPKPDWSHRLAKPIDVGDLPVLERSFPSRVKPRPGEIQVYAGQSRRAFAPQDPTRVGARVGGLPITDPSRRPALLRYFTSRRAHGAGFKNLARLVGHSSPCHVGVSPRSECKRNKSKWKPLQ
jgi:hypothetical protein